MGAFKEIYDESVYLPEDSSSQIELVGLLDALAGPLLGSYEPCQPEGGKLQNFAPQGNEVATPIRPLRLHAGWFSL